MRTIFQSFIVLSAAFLVGCDGNTDYTWQLTNDSSSDIVAYTSTGFDLSAPPDSVVILQGSNEVVGVFSKLGGSGTEMLPENAFSALIVVNASGDTMQSSYVDPGSWMSEIEQIKKVPSQYEHTYTFVVNDNDF